MFHSLQHAVRCLLAVRFGLGVCTTLNWAGASEARPIRIGRRGTERATAPQSSAKVTTRPGGEGRGALLSHATAEQAAVLCARNLDSLFENTTSSDILPSELTRSAPTIINFSRLRKKGALHEPESISLTRRRISARSGQNRLCVQFIEQRLGVSQVGGVEALGEPAVDFGDHRARLIAPALFREQSGEARRCTQLF